MTRREENRRADEPGRHRPDRSHRTDLVAVLDDPLAALLDEVRDVLGESIVDVLLKPATTCGSASARTRGWRPARP